LHSGRRFTHTCNFAIVSKDFTYMSKPSHCASEREMLALHVKTTVREVCVHRWGMYEKIKKYFLSMFMKPFTQAQS